MSTRSATNLVLVGLALGLFGWVSQYVVAAMPTWITWPAYAVAVLLLIWAVIDLVHERYFAKPESRGLADLATADLRTQTLQFCAELRTFEAGRGEASHQRMFTEMAAARDLRNSGATEAALIAQWDQSRRADLTVIERTESEYRIRFHAKALALRNEMAARLGYFPPPEDRRARVLDFGSLAGPWPIAQLADYLEELARKLP